MTQDRIRRIQKMVDAFQKEMEGLTNDTLQAILDSTGMLKAMPWLQGLSMQGQGLDPYRILGLERSATDEEVKKRYRELLLKLHPDTAGIPGTETLLQLVTAAYKNIARERSL